MKVEEILESYQGSLFDDDWIDNTEVLASAKGPKYMADMWSHHRRVGEIVSHLRNNFAQLGPTTKEAAKLLIKWHEKRIIRQAA